MSSVRPTVLFLVHDNDDQTNNNNNNNEAGRVLDIVNNREQEEIVDLEDPTMETDDDDDDDDDEQESEGEEGGEEEESEESEEEESDNESCTSCVSPRRFEFFSADGLFELPKGHKEYNMITERFFFGLGELGNHTTVLAVQKNMFIGPDGHARMESFQIFSQAMSVKRGGDANIKCAWYGSSKDEISGIISHGFGKCEKPANSEQYGVGIYLTPQEANVERMMSSPIDENGIRHVLLCRVILGNMEQVRPGSDQIHPRSQMYDSGTDNLVYPKKYIVWSTNINTHILPEYVVSFKAPVSLEGFRRSLTSAMKPSSSWMPFITLINVLSRCLHPKQISFIKKSYAAFRARKLSRAQLIVIVRKIAGDNLLIYVIRAFRAKVDSQASSSGPRLPSGP